VVDGGSAPDAVSARIRAGFTGHESDVETGLVNMGGRLYDSRIGCVLQADPALMESPFWSQGLNRYSYVFNNPLNALDPSGFETEDDDSEGGAAPVAGPNDEFEVDENGEIVIPIHSGRDPDSANDSNDDEAETSPGQGDPADESAVGSASETLGAGEPGWHIPNVLDWAGGFGLGSGRGRRGRRRRRGRGQRG
jgi:RHS repeat-associated protein